MRTEDDDWRNVGSEILMNPSHRSEESPDFPLPFHQSPHQLYQPLQKEEESQMIILLLSLNFRNKILALKNIGEKDWRRHTSFYK